MDEHGLRIYAPYTNITRVLLRRYREVQIGLRDGNGGREGVEFVKTKRLPAKYRALVEGKFPNAGPDPSVKGMKKHFYGRDSICVMCGRFLYFLGETFDEINTRIYALAK